jgi:hypothetical protein
VSGKPEETGPIFYRVSPRYWMNRAWTDDARLLGLYLLTSPHRTLEGLFWLPKQYVLGDLQWSPERLAEPFGLLRDDGFLGYDDAAEIALVVKALKYQAPANPNMRTAALRRIKTLPETPLDARFLTSCDEYCEPLAELLREQLPKRFGKPQLFSSLLSSTPSAPAREAPVDKSAAPVENLGEEQAPPEPQDLVPVVGPIGRLCGVKRIVEALDETSDLNHAIVRYLAAVDELVADYLGETNGKARDEARATCRYAALERITTKPDNPAAYLTAAAGNATCLGDLVGDDLVKQLRRPKKRGKSC